MRLSANRLLGYRVRDVHQIVTRRDCAFYALSVGFGQNAADIREHRFIDPARSVAVVPSMALVLGYPGFWLGEPETGVDAAKVAHVEQQVTLHAELPPDGAVVGRTRVTGLFSRGERGLALTSEREIVCAETGAPLATVSQTHFLRGNSCADSLPQYSNAPEPGAGGAPDHAFEQATRPEQALLYRLNGDMNPLHIDPAVAASAGFSQPILHGMCSFGIATRAVLAKLTEFETSAVRRIAMRFRAPVFPGETICTEIWEDGRFRVRSQQRGVVVIDGGRVEFKTGARVRPETNGAASQGVTASLAEKV